MNETYFYKLTINPLNTVFSSTYKPYFSYNIIKIIMDKTDEI